MQEFYEDVERPRGGRWVKLHEKGDRLDGKLLAIEVRDRTDPEGNVVLGRKSGKARKIYRVTVEVDKREDAEDDGLRIWDANEAGQASIRDAYKAAGTKELIGGRFAAVVTADAPDSFSQATYKAKFEPPAKTVELPDDDPFGDKF
jgi:hypothetical protein